jgi:ABC-type uncharacterized transport system permease subunit
MMTTELLIAFLASTAGAATPLVVASMGELVTERSGVLNLGMEGMMLVGAVAGFSVTFSGTRARGLACSGAGGGIADRDGLRRAGADACRPIRSRRAWR